MITLEIHKGASLGRKVPYDPPVGTIIKFKTECGDECLTVVSRESAEWCCTGCYLYQDGECMLSEESAISCDTLQVRLVCYGRVFKPFDKILEEL